MKERTLQKRVFISHNCLDHPLVYILQQELQSGGLSAIVDPFIGGDRTCDKAQKEIRESTHFVLLATGNSINSEHEATSFNKITESWHRARWVSIEYKYAELCALKESIVLICVKVGCTSIPGSLQAYIHIPYVESSPVSQLARSILKCVNSTSPTHRFSGDPKLSESFVEQGREKERDAAIQDDERKLHSAIDLYDKAILQDFCNHHAWLNKGWCWWKLYTDLLAWKCVNMAQLLRPDSIRTQHIIGRMILGFRSLK
jgi:hypothetical protein